MRYATDLLGWIAVIALIAISTSAEAVTNPVPDPTMPDASTLPQTVDSEASNRPILQSVILGSKNKAAIINGQRVMLGQKYEQATLIQVTENKAVFRRPDHTLQTLKMDYGMDKKVLLPKDLSTLPKKNTKRLKSTHTNQVRVP